ncbi:hypothetical protein RND81_03G038900 [Saponaria officinalis]|uniref:BZIP domain-containing protein n=1 Tax=Saponaria officinalis TaxID=3572 RepID=A0AAW1LY67_SAPOF
MICSQNPVQLDFPPNNFLNNPLLFSQEITRHNSVDNTTTQNKTRNYKDDKERKQRRMMSNRLSARRSRMQKKRHLENLKNKLDRLTVQNQELKTRLGTVTYRCYVVGRDNESLHRESMLLEQRLCDLYTSMLAMQLPNYSI